MQWSRRHTWLLVLALASLVTAFAIKHPCTTHAWEDHYQYEHYCYSDILPIYYAHGHDQDVVPYLEDPPDGVNEYPVLTGLLAHVVALATDTLTSYMVLTFVLLLLAGAATSLALWRMAGQGALLAWAAAPTVPIHGLTNWDLLAVGLAAGGWWAWRAGRRFTSALLFGLGGAAKLYPAFFLPLLFFGVLRSEWPRIRAWWANRTQAATGGVQAASETLSTLAGGTLGLAGPNLAVAAAAPGPWLATWTFHAERHPDFETPWQSFLKPLLQPLAPGFDWGQGWADLVGELSALLFLTALILLSWRVLHGRDPLAAGGLLVLVFMLTNRVYSPQYTLWALPILILLGAAWRPSVLYIAADTVNFIVRYKLFTPPPGGSGWNMAWEPWSQFAVNMRWVFLAWATWTIAKRHGFLPQEWAEDAVDQEAGTNKPVGARATDPRDDVPGRPTPADPARAPD